MTVHSIPDRLLAKVDYGEECWIWKGSLKANGYGQCWGPKKSAVSAHRAFYEAANGPVPDGLELDHLCMVKRCVNPAHLEAVTRRENIRRRRVANGTVSGP